MNHIPWRRALAAALPIALLPGLALGATPLGTDQLLGAALLTAGDLPVGMTSDGPTDESRFDTDAAAFGANGGLGIAEQTWSAAGPTTVYRLFDFRMLFPSPEAAQGYLDAADDVLSETAASGLQAVNGGVSVADGFEHYALDTVVNEQPAGLQNMLFRVGPMVAKVFVGGFGTSADDVFPLARAAALRMVAALSNAATGPSASPAASVSAGPGTSPATSPAPEDTTAPASPAPSDADGLVHQWATSASASTAYGPSSWSAQQAAGPPNTTAYGDNGTAWAPAQESGSTDWLDLRYDQAVVPSRVGIHETDGSGFVTKVEAYDTAKATWVTLWTGTDATPTGAVGTFSPPLAKTDVAVDRIRVTIDTDAPDWNEIDAVELVGRPPS